MRAKKFGKKIVGKKCKKRFLFKHEYREQEMSGGKTRETIFPESQYIANKKVVKKIVGKKCEIRFFIFTRIS